MILWPHIAQGMHILLLRFARVYYDCAISSEQVAVIYLTYSPKIFTSGEAVLLLPHCKSRIFEIYVKIGSGLTARKQRQKPRTVYIVFENRFIYKCMRCDPLSYIFWYVSYIIYITSNYEYWSSFDPIIRWTVGVISNYEYWSSFDPIIRWTVGGGVPLYQLQFLYDAGPNSYGGRWFIWQPIPVTHILCDICCPFYRHGLTLIPVWMDESWHEE